MADEILKGSCLCGGVAYEAKGPIEAMASCHCAQCRKQSGAEFATNGNVNEADFQFVRGEELLQGFESSPGQFRMFCRECGSPILKRNQAQPGKIRLRLGCLDTPTEARPALRVFMSEKSSWTVVADDVPQFDTMPGAPPKG